MPPLASAASVVRSLGLNLSVVRDGEIRGRHGGRHRTRISDANGVDDAPNHTDPARPRDSLCAWQESNLRPCAPEAHALSPELQARGASLATSPPRELRSPPMVVPPSAGT